MNVIKQEYISMVLQMLQDKTVPSFLKADTFNELKEKENRNTGRYRYKNDKRE